MSGGMNLAYRLAQQSYRQGHENRVIVLSDGDANIGPSSHEAILNRLTHFAQRGITLSTVGFGQGNYRDTLMEQLADKGDGNYSYIDTMQEARRVFGEDLGATLTTIARDVKIQVEFDPEQVLTYRLIGYENRAIADKDFRNDAVDAGEIGPGHTVTALYDVILTDLRSGPLATVRVRHKAPGPDRPAVEQAVTLPSAAVERGFWDSSRDLRRATAVATFAEKLRLNPDTAEVSWSQIIEVMQAAQRPRDDRDVEAIQLMRKAESLDPSGSGRIAGH
jgi:Ca-activated chloride channel family protein